MFSKNILKMFKIKETEKKNGKDRNFSQGVLIQLQFSILEIYIVLCNILKFMFSFLLQLNFSLIFIIF